MSLESISEKEQLGTPSTQDETRKVTEPGVDLWQSIRTIFELQNQAPPLLPASRAEAIPASFAQERLWLTDQLAPGSSAYNIPFAFRIYGKLDKVALAKSLQAVSDRHESLRTKFASIDGQPIQVIDEVTPVTFAVIDLSQTPTEDPNSKVLQLVQEEAQRPFNLVKDSLFRAQLIVLSNEEHILSLTVHHIIFDGWSEGILLQELSNFYTAYSSDTTPSLTPLSVQYADFSNWQRQWLQGPFLEALQSYWREQLSGNLSDLNLPTDYPRPAIQARRSASEKFVIPETLTSALKQLSRQERATLFPTVLAAFQILLHHYTEQTDLFVCTPTANRNRNELKGLIGYFVNLLILRNDLSGNPSFRELLARIRQNTSGANAHQDLPIQQATNLLGGQQVSFSQVLFALQNTPQQTLKLGDLSIEAINVDNGTADFDLFLSLVEISGTLVGTLKYNTDLFEAASIRQMLSHFQQVLENIVANPTQSISQLLPLGEPEKQNLQDKRANAKNSNSLQIARTTEKIEAPINPLELQLVQIWEQVFNIYPIGAQDNFFELGGNSMLATRLLTSIKQTFNKELPISTLLQAPTIRELTKILRQEGWSEPWTSLIPIQPDGSKKPIFLVHDVYGDVLCFANLVRYLGKDQPAYGLRPVGANGKDEPLTRVQDMASYYIKEVQTVQPKGPYFLGGMCAGGVIAFEMARQLQQRGEKVALLAVLNSPPPKPINFILDSWPLYLKAIRLLVHLRKLLQTSPLKWSAYFASRKQEFKKVSSLKSRTDFYGFKIRLANMKALRNYFPKSYKGEINLFLASEKAATYRQALSSPRAIRKGWERLAQGGFKVHPVPGSRDTFLKEPNVSFLADQLRGYLERLDSPHNNS